MTRSRLYSEHGYTLVELIVSTQILILLLVFSYQVFTFLTQTIQNNERDACLLNATILLRDFLSAKTSTGIPILSIRSNRIVFRNSTREELSLDLERKQLLWSGRSILPSEVQVPKLEIFFHSIRNAGSPDPFYKADVNHDQSVELEEYVHYNYITLRITVRSANKSTVMSYSINVPQRLRRRYGTEIRR